MKQKLDKGAAIAVNTKRNDVYGQNRGHNIKWLTDTS